jgi:regulator of protease activity HflC (stomatin/prohibitin superfamily)
VLKLDVKDLVLPGEMKLLLNQVIEAEKKAAAQVIMRREEVASTRSMANTAQMLERNPALLRLKELEAFKEIASAIPNLTLVMGQPDLLRSLGGLNKD